MICLSVQNGKDVLSIHSSVKEENNSVNHSVIHNDHLPSGRSRADRINDMSKWRIHAFKVIIPRRLSQHTDSDLKLMRVSLKNAISASTVHMLRIERELKKRGCDLTIL